MNSVINNLFHLQRDAPSQCMSYDVGCYRDCNNCKFRSHCSDCIKKVNIFCQILCIWWVCSLHFDSFPKIRFKKLQYITLCTVSQYIES